MKLRKKKVEIATVLAVSLISITFGTLLIRDSDPGFIVMATKPMPGTFEISIYGDAYGLYTFLETFQHFSVHKLEWSTIFPLYPPWTYVHIALDVQRLDFDKTMYRMYHLSLKGLEECSIEQNGVTMFSVQCESGELDFVFSNDYHTLNITGMLEGDVHFYIHLPPYIPPFDYEGRELTIRAHIGM